MNNFSDTAKSITITENGAEAYNTSGINPILDLFALAGALRNRPDSDIEQKIEKAFQTSPILATKLMFYIGNIRGGLGERHTFRIMLRYMAINHPEWIIANIDMIPHYNRWDSLYELVGTNCEKVMWDFLCGALSIDSDIVDSCMLSNTTPMISLAGKWAKSVNASNAETRRLGRTTAEHLNMTDRQYRKLLTKLRGHLNIVETYMSAGEWDKIDFSTVPSYAMKNYTHAFNEHVNDKYMAYLEEVKQGSSKINASVLYPYDLVDKYLYCGYNNRNKINETVELQWENLPNYLDKPSNILCMCDISGSMSGRPMATSVGLSTYFAQHNTGNFHNLYMSFTDNPHFISLDGCNTLHSCVRKIADTDMGYNTNLDRTFDYILKWSLKNNIDPSTMPTALCVISDMEIDRFYYPDYNFDFVDKWEKRFSEVGYKLPKLIFWNVEARHDIFLSHNPNVIYVSGNSPSSFKELCGYIEGKTAIDIMMETLENPIYDRIREPEI